MRLGLSVLRPGSLFRGEDKRIVDDLSIRRLYAEVCVISCQQFKQ
jgi:hypothetical protein